MAAIPDATGTSPDRPERGASEPDMSAQEVRRLIAYRNRLMAELREVERKLEALMPPQRN